jgi:hypothetical protein
VDLDFVVVTCAGEEVARHRRSLATHRTITDPAHARARRTLRRQAGEPDGQHPVAAGQIEVEQRDLADYDRALGVA